MHAEGKPLSGHAIGGRQLMPARPPRIAILAGEASGDQLGAALIAALRARLGPLELFGIGGTAMAGQGLESLFPLEDIAVMGLGPVIRRLPVLLARIRLASAQVEAFAPDLVLTIDSPDFCKRVAKRLRARVPKLPILHCVCPSVWAWRPGRARAMRGLFDAIFCLLPFEPAALQRLHGPPGYFIGHPLIERLADLRPRNAAESAARASMAAPLILLLPGSRLSVIERMLPIFLQAITLLGKEAAGARFVIPTLPHLVGPLEAMARTSAKKLEILTTQPEKLAAFRAARGAIAASGTVTLELALAGLPMVAAYRLARWEAAIARRLIKVSSAILPNLVLGENIVPEFLQEAADPAAIAAAFAPLLQDGSAREAQLTAFARLEAMMRAAGPAPSEVAAEMIARFIADPAQARDHLAMRHESR